MIKKLIIGSVLFAVIIAVVMLSNPSGITRPSQNQEPLTDQDKDVSTSLSADKFEEREAMGNKDNPMAYWTWFYHQRANHNTIPANAFGNAVNAMHAMKAREANKLAANSIMPATPSNSWVSVGPTPIDVGGGNFYSGRVAALAMDPAHSGTIYLGAAQGGIWKSTNSGNTWTPLTDNQTSLATGSIAVDSSGIVYVGTGEGNLSCDSYYGAGILKSTDGGTTWSRLGATTFGSSTISKIIINSNNQNTLVVSTSFGVTDSSTNSCVRIHTGGSPGIYRSTNGGSTWTQVYSDSSGVSDLIADPSNSQVLYAGERNVAAGVLKSTDGGMTWNALATQPLSSPGRIALGITSKPSTTLFVATSNNTGGMLFKSTNNGTSWSSVNTPTGAFGGSFCESQCWYDIFIAPDPTSANILYLGGLDLYRSTNGGTSWTDLGGYAGYTHPDQHAFVFDPSSHSHIYSGNDGGIWSATAGDTCTPSSCWTQKNTGLAITQFQSIAAHPSISGTYFGGTQDNGSPEHTSSTTWTELIGGDGGWTAFDPTTPTIMYHTFFNITPQRSDDSGSNWSDITTGINTGDPSSFYIPMAIDISNPSILFLGSDHLYKTTNKGDAWSATSLVLSSGKFSAIKVAPSNDSYAYTGTSSGQFFSSTNGGSNFTEHDTGLPSVFLTQIAVDPTNPQKVYTTFSAIGGSHVFVSSNMGAS
jgi:photosystem II stability/assembly factor-like uncharacterized protein